MGRSDLDEAKRKTWSNKRCSQLRSLDRTKPVPFPDLASGSAPTHATACAASHDTHIHGPSHAHQPSQPPCLLDDAEPLASFPNGPPVSRRAAPMSKLWTRDVKKPARRQPSVKHELALGSDGGSSGCGGHQAALVRPGVMHELRSERLTRRYTSRRRCGGLMGSQGTKWTSHKLCKSSVAM